MRCGDAASRAIAPRRLGGTYSGLGCGSNGVGGPRGNGASALWVLDALSVGPRERCGRRCACVSHYVAAASGGGSMRTTEEVDGWNYKCATDKHLEFCDWILQSESAVRGQAAAVADRELRLVSFSRIRSLRFLVHCARIARL